MSAPRSWRISRPVNAPRASGSACGVRSPVRYGRNVEPVRARPPRRGLVRQLGELPADDAAQPRQRAGGGQHHAHLVPGAGHGVAEGVHAGLRVGPVLGQRGEHDAGRPHRDAQRPGPVDADAEPARGLVARARRDGDAGRRPAATPPATRARSAATPRSISSVSQHLVAPAPLRHVEQQRARGVGDVDRPLAGELEPHVVLGQHHVRDPGVVVRLVLAQPQQLGRGEAGQRAVAGELDEPVEADLAPRSPRTRRRCAGRSRGSPDGSGGRLESSVTSPCIWPERPMPATPSVRPSSACSVASHQSSGFCSDQPGLGVESGYGDLAALEHFAVFGDGDDLDRGGSDVDADGGA